MRILFLSDLHLGSLLFKSESIILDLLDKEYDKVFLIGDIVDVWEDKCENIVNKYCKLINKINLLGNVVIIKGNHDPSVLMLESIFTNVNVTNIYVDDNFVVVHGHEWDNTLIAGRIFFSIHKFFERFDLNLKAFVRNIFYRFLAFCQHKNKDIDIVSYAEKGIISNCINYSNVIISGHTHVPKIVNGGNFMYINTGDWVYNLSYVECIDGDFILIKNR